MPPTILPPITERTYTVAQELMAQDGMNASDPAAVSLYVERLIARERFFRTSDRMRHQAAQLAPAELERLIEEEVSEVEAQFRKGVSRADRA